MAQIARQGGGDAQRGGVVQPAAQQVFVPVPPYPGQLGAPDQTLPLGQGRFVGQNVQGQGDPRRGTVQQRVGALFRPVQGRG